MTRLVVQRLQFSVTENKFHVSLHEDWDLDNGWNHASIFVLMGFALSRDSHEYKLSHNFWNCNE